MATPRGGSTWVMEIIASQPGMKYYDEPFNMKRPDVITTGRILSREDLMPDTGNKQNICDYLLDLANNKIGGMNPPPFRKNYRLLTDRIVFKLHELEFMTEQLRQSLDAQVLCLYRHPIPTSLSRNLLPRLDLFMGSKYYRERYLSKESWAYANKIYNEGAPLARGVLSWCFENVDLLRSEYKDNWIPISYEELLLNSKKCCGYLADRLDLDDLDTMLRSVGEPSANITMSGKDTRSIMENSDEEKRKKRLVTKWRGNVDADLEKSVMDILKCFEIDMYVEGRFIPQKPYLLFPDTENPSA